MHYWPVRLMRARGLRRWWRALRPPLVLQHEDADCGPASLLSVLRFWGGDESLAVIRDLAHTDAQGTTLLRLRDAATALGFRAHGARGSFDELLLEPMPCIAHLTWDDDRAHFAVVYRAKPNRVWLGDPSRGRAWRSRAEFEASWKTRSVLLLSPTERLRDQPSIGWVTWLFRYLRVESVWLVQSLFLGVTATALGLSTAVFIRLLVDRYVPERNVTMIVATGAVLLGILLVRALSRYLRQLFLVQLNRSVSSTINREFLAHLYRLPIRFFESRATGDVTARIHDGVRIQEGMLQLGGTAIIDTLVVVGSSVCLLWIARPLGAMTLLCIPLYAVALTRSAIPVRREQGAALEAYGRVEAGYIDSMKGISDVLGLGVSNFFASANSDLFRSFTHRVERLGRIHAGLSLLAELAGGVLLIVALSWGALLVVSRDLQLGQLMAGYSLLAGIIPSTERLVQSWAGLQQTAVSAGRFRDLMPTTLPPRATSTASRTTIRRELRLESIAFDWPSGKRQFNDLSLSLPIGRVTGLLGANGAGKTTLVRILNRTYPASRGEVLVDGIPAEEWKLDSYRRSVSIFHSDTHLFGGFVATNVLLGRFRGSEQCALTRLEAFGFGGVLDRFPSRWSERIGEGGRRLSTGEGQVVGLMRALAGEPDVLLVDEGLAGTDPELGTLILDTLIRYGREHAVLIVSHDARVLRRSDRLLVLEGGAIRAEGPPRSLLGTENLPHPQRWEPMPSISFEG